MGRARFPSTLWTQFNPFPDQSPLGRFAHIITVLSALSSLLAHQLLAIIPSENGVN